MIQDVEKPATGATAAPGLRSRPHWGGHSCDSGGDREVTDHGGSARTGEAAGLGGEDVGLGQAAGTFPAEHAASTVSLAPSAGKAEQRAC